MAESVDALVSNTSGRKAVPVRPRLRVLLIKGALPPFIVSLRTQTPAPPGLVNFCSRKSHGLRRAADAAFLFKGGSAPFYCVPADTNLFYYIQILALAQA